MSKKFEVPQDNQPENSQKRKRKRNSKSSKNMHNKDSDAPVSSNDKLDKMPKIEVLGSDDKTFEKIIGWFKDNTSLPKSKQGWMRLGLNLFLFSALQASSSTYTVKSIEWRQVQGGSPVMVPIESYPHQPWNLVARLILLTLIGGQLYTSKKPKWLAQMVMDTVSDEDLPKAIKVIEETTDPVMDLSQDVKEPESVAVEVMEPEKDLPAPSEIFGEIPVDFSMVNRIDPESLRTMIRELNVLRVFEDEGSSLLSEYLSSVWGFVRGQYRVLQKADCNIKQFMVEYKKDHHNIIANDGVFWSNVKIDQIDVETLKLVLIMNGRPSATHHKDMFGNTDENVILSNNKAQVLLESDLDIPERDELLDELSKDTGVILLRLDGVWSISKI